MKIQITESDIKRMVLSSIKRLHEAIRYGVANGSGTWDPQDVFVDSGLDDDEIDAMIRRYPQIDWNGYSISASVSSTEFSGEDGPGNTSSYGDEKNFGGEYEKAVADIAGISNPVLRNKLTQSLNDFCESLECEDFEEDSPYDEDWDEDRYYEDKYRDIDEQINEHGPDDQYYIPNSFTFNSLQDFLSKNETYGLNMGTYRCILTHSELPHLDPQLLYVTFYPWTVCSDKSDPSTGYVGHGWEIEEVECEYEKIESPYSREPQPIKRGEIGWLDDDVNKYIYEHEDEIKEHLYQ